jgi:DNA-binding Xre family transcriptional regulator
MSTIIKEFSKNKIYQVLLEKVGFDEKAAKDLKARISEATGESPKMLTYYLDNRKQPELGQVAVIAQVLECTIEDLIEYEQPEPKAEDNH